MVVSARRLKPTYHHDRYRREIETRLDGGRGEVLGIERFPGVATPQQTEYAAVSALPRT